MIRYIPIIVLFTLIVFLHHSCISSSAVAESEVDVNISLGEIKKELSEFTESIENLVNDISRISKAIQEEHRLEKPFAKDVYNKLLFLENRILSLERNIYNLEKGIDPIKEKVQKSNKQYYGLEKQRLNQEVILLQEKIIDLQERLIQKNKEILGLKKEVAKYIGARSGLLNSVIPATELFALDENEELMYEDEHRIMLKNNLLNYIFFTRKRTSSNKSDFYLIVNGDRYGPVKHIWIYQEHDYYDINENGRFYFINATDSDYNSFKIKIEGKEYGPHGSIGPVVFYGEYSFAFVFENKPYGNVYINYNGTVIGPYDEVKSLTIDDQGLKYVYQNLEGANYFVRYGKKTLGPYSHASYTKLLDSVDFIVYEDLNKKWFFRAKDSIFGPFENASFERKGAWYFYDLLNMKISEPLKSPAYRFGNLKSYYIIDDNPITQKKDLIINQNIRIEIENLIGEPIQIDENDFIVRYFLNSKPGQYFYCSANKQTYGPYENAFGIYYNPVNGALSYLYTEKIDEYSESRIMLYNKRKTQELGTSYYHRYHQEIRGGKYFENTLVVDPTNQYNVIINGKLYRNEGGFNYKYNEANNAFEWLYLSGTSVFRKTFYLD